MKTTILVWLQLFFIFFTQRASTFVDEYNESNEGAYDDGYYYEGEGEGDGDGVDYTDDKVPDEDHVRSSSTGKTAQPARRFLPTLLTRKYSVNEDFITEWSMNEMRERFSCRVNEEKSAIRKNIALAEKKKYRKVMDVNGLAKKDDSSKNSRKAIASLQRTVSLAKSKSHAKLEAVVESSSSILEGPSDALRDKTARPPSAGAASSSSTPSSSSSGATAASTLKDSDLEETDGYHLDDDDNSTDPYAGLSAKEIREMKANARLERRLANEALLLTVPVALDCEDTACVVCKVLVEEAAEAIISAVGEPRFQRLEDVLMSGRLCKSRNIQSKYSEVVRSLCESRFFNESMAFHVDLVKALDTTNYWTQPLPLINLKKQACRSLKVCDDNRLETHWTPQTKMQEQWDEKCFVCQAYANDLEERVVMSKQLTDTALTSLIHSTCDRLELSVERQNYCREIYREENIRDLLWMSRVLGETSRRQGKMEKKFSDLLCEGVGYCEPWIEPELKRIQEAQSQVEQIFF